MLQQLKLERLKGIDVADVKRQARRLGDAAIRQAKYVGSKRVVLAGRTVNPFLLGAVAAAVIGTAAYLILRRRSGKTFDGDTSLYEQMQPAK